MPTRERKEKLQRAGLGRRKVKFNASLSAVELKEKLEEVFPRLVYGRGFELLRRGSSGNGLILIHQPGGGYTVKYLRESAGLGQALMFVRPLQANLDVSAEESSVDFHSEVSEFQCILSVDHFNDDRVRKTKTSDRKILIKPLSL